MPLSRSSLLVQRKLQKFEDKNSAESLNLSNESSQGRRTAYNEEVQRTSEERDRAEYGQKNLREEAEGGEEESRVRDKNEEEKKKAGDEGWSFGKQLGLTARVEEERLVSFLVGIEEVNQGLGE